MSPEMTEPKMLTNWLKPIEHVTQCHCFDNMLPKEVFLHYITHRRDPKTGQGLSDDSITKNVS
jgi:hypothetical protein